MKKKAFYILIGLLTLISCQNQADFNDFKNGDIIFQISNSAQSRAIQIATDSRYSHMGLIYKKDNDIYVFEAVQPVKLTPLNEWIKRGKNGHFVVKRLKNADKLFTDNKLNKLRTIGKSYWGKDYDLYFEWSDERIYCSELIWKLYYKALDIKIGKLERLKDFDLSHEIVKEKLIERYGNNIPKDEIVISPASIYNSDKLKTIYKN